MSKPIETLSEIIRNPKHAFRKAERQVPGGKRIGVVGQHRDVRQRQRQRLVIGRDEHDERRHCPADDQHRIAPTLAGDQRQQHRRVVFEQRGGNGS